MLDAIDRGDAIAAQRMGLAALTLNYHPSVLDAHVAAMERAERAERAPVH